MKHPKYNLKGDIIHILPTYRYAYSAKVDFALITSFKEFRFFNCTSRVGKNEDLTKYCIIDWTYKDYILNFDKLWKYFEKENVRNGSLSKLYIGEKDNHISVEEAFLDDLNYWRIEVAKDIKKYHPDYSS